MRQGVANSPNASYKLERNRAFKVIAIQALVSVLIALIWLFFKSTDAGAAALVGGFACVLPSFLFTWGMFALLSPKSGQRMALIFFVGEFIKLLISAASVGILVMHFPSEMMPILVGFVGAQFGTWLAPLLIGIDGKRVTR